MDRRKMIARLIDEREAREAPPRFEFAFWFGDRVRIATDTDGAVGLVTGILIRPGEPHYLVTWSDTRDEQPHYGFELESADANPSAA